MATTITNALPTPAVQVAVEATESKYCCNWQQTAVIVSLVVAVAGVVLSIFQASFFGVLGFLALGISAAVFHSLGNREMEKMTTDLTVKATEETDAMTKVNQKMEVQVGELDKNTKEMEDHVGKLQADLEQREALQKDLVAERDRLAAQVAELNKTKGDLEKDLASMKDNSKQVANRVQELVQQNLTLGKDLGAFKVEAGGVVQQEVTLQNSVAKFQNGFDGDLSALSQELAIGKDISGELLKNIGAKNAEVERQLKETTEQSAKEKADLKAASDLLKTQQEALNKALADLEKDKLALTNEVNTIKMSDLESKQKLEQLMKVEADLKAELQNNKADLLKEAQLRQNIRAYEAQIPKLHEASHHLQEQIKALLAQKEKLTAK